MKKLTHKLFILLVFCLLTGCTSILIVDAKNHQNNSQEKISFSQLKEKKWPHGSLDCDSNSDPALVLDTGATEEALDFPIYKTIQSINKKLSASDGRPNRKLLVIHSHIHSDHYAGDRQFSGKPDVTLIKPNQNAMTEYFSFN